MSEKKSLCAGIFLVINATFSLAWAEQPSFATSPQAVSAIAQPSVIAVLPFSQPDNIGVDLASVLSSDLTVTGVFRSLRREDLGGLARVTDQREIAVDFESLKLLGVQYVVTGTVQGNVLRLRMFDGQSREQMLAFDMPAVPSQDLWRYVVHQASNLVFEKVTGMKGVANTRMVYVAIKGIGSSKSFELVVSDIDGANPRAIAVSREPMMSPSWSPDGKQIAFVGIEKGRQAIYISAIHTAVVWKLISEPGINGSPAWSPDGKSIAVTLSMEVNPDIYIVDVASGARHRLTDDPGIDTEPTWSPDGTAIAFTSARSGQPQIYQVPVSGGQPQLLTTVGKQNLRASYAPDGKKIAFVNYQAGVYRIAVMALATGEMKLLGEGPLDESPSFSPNSQDILYFAGSREGSRLVRASVDGRIRTMMRLPEGSDAREPAWSPQRQ